MNDFFASVLYFFTRVNLECSRGNRETSNLELLEKIVKTFINTIFAITFILNV